MKNKLFDVLVIGTGLSSLSFIDAYLENKKKVNVISYKNNKENKANIKNKHIFKILPPQMLGAEKKVNNYFYFNKISINQNSKFIKWIIMN